MSGSRRALCSRPNQCAGPGQTPVLAVGPRSWTGRWGLSTPRKTQPERGAEYATCGRPFTLCRYKTHTLASELLHYTALSVVLLYACLWWRLKKRPSQLLLPSLQAALPSVPPDTKLSKLDVLVLATNYIAHLTETLDQGGMLTEHTASRPGGYLHPVKVRKWQLTAFHAMPIIVLLTYIIQLEDLLIGHH